MDAQRIKQLLRPKKVHSALARRWFEYQLDRVPVTERGNPQDLGTPYGGWMMPMDVLQPGWRCYCVGAGGDISFDLELARGYQASVFIVEPVEAYVRQAEASIQNVPGIAVCHAALATTDGLVRMQLTHDSASQSVSSANLYDGAHFLEVPGRSLASLMAERGDTSIDLFKLDIEGGEYGLLPQLDLRALGVKVFATQLHHSGSVRDARELISQLEAAGFELVARRPTIKFTFVRRDLLSSRIA
jgi:FkbM family methyltransferase